MSRKTTIPGTVAVIDTAANTVIATIVAGNSSIGIALTPDGSKAYVTNGLSNNVAVIDTATNTVTATVTVGSHPFGVSVTPDGSKVFVANEDSQPGSVSVIDTATNTVTATIPVGSGQKLLASSSSRRSLHQSSLARQESRTAMARAFRHWPGNTVGSMLRLRHWAFPACGHCKRRSWTFAKDSRANGPGKGPGCVKTANLIFCQS
jgi:YVTN family beta-propeller protein